MGMLTRGPGGGVDTRALRSTFARFATGVTVVTVGDPAPHGMTANSFTSVSLDPALLLVCVGHQTVMHGRLRTGMPFGVSVLSSGQEAIARHFADKWRTIGPAEFETVPCRPGPARAVPLVEGSLARFECELWRSYEGGDHTIFVGRVLSADTPADGDGLLFFEGRFAGVGVPGRVAS